MDSKTSAGASVGKREPAPVSKPARRKAAPGARQRPALKTTGNVARLAVVATNARSAAERDVERLQRALLGCAGGTRRTLGTIVAMVNGARAMLAMDPDALTDAWHLLRLAANQADDLHSQVEADLDGCGLVDDRAGEASARFAERMHGELHDIHVSARREAEITKGGAL